MMGAVLQDYYKIGTLVSRNGRCQDYIIGLVTKPRIGFKVKVHFVQTTHV